MNDQAPSYAIADRLGTLTGAVSDGGQASESPELDPFGVPVDEAPALAQIDQQTLGFLGGAGREGLPDSGLVKMGARIYDAETGAFVIRDPVTGEPSEPARRVAYAYAFNGPGRYVDLDGRSALDGLCGPLFPAACGPSGNPNVTRSAEEAKDYYQAILDNPDSSDLAWIVANVGKTLSSTLDCENFGDSVAMALPIPGFGLGKAAAKLAEKIPGLRFAPGKWLAHFQKHGKEFGYKNSVEYLEGARSLVGRKGVQTFKRANGDQLFYDAGTNEFAVVTSTGVLRTYFKPKEGAAYWKGQTSK